MKLNFDSKLYFPYFFVPGCEMREKILFETNFAHENRKFLCQQVAFNGESLHKVFFLLYTCLEWYI